jgi:hypothetical protein
MTTSVSGQSLTSIISVIVQAMTPPTLSISEQIQSIIHTIDERGRDSHTQGWTIAFEEAFVKYCTAPAIYETLRDCCDDVQRYIIWCRALHGGVPSTFEYDDHTSFNMDYTYFNTFLHDHIDNVTVDSWERVGLSTYSAANMVTWSVDKDDVDYACPVNLHTCMLIWRESRAGGVQTNRLPRCVSFEVWMRMKVLMPRMFRGVHRVSLTSAEHTVALLQALQDKINSRKRQDSLSQSESMCTIRS